MGIEQRHFPGCRDSSIRSSRARTGSAKKGKGRTGSTAPHEGDRGRVEAKTQTRMIGTAPVEVTNPVGSVLLIGVDRFDFSVESPTPESRVAPMHIVVGR